MLACGFSAIYLLTDAISKVLSTDVPSLVLTGPMKPPGLQAVNAASRFLKLLQSLTFVPPQLWPLCAYNTSDPIVSPPFTPIFLSPVHWRLLLHCCAPSPMASCTRAVDCWWDATCINGSSALSVCVRLSPGYVDVSLSARSQWLELSKTYSVEESDEDNGCLPMLHIPVSTSSSLTDAMVAVHGVLSAK